MKWICRCCRKNIERDKDIYSNPYLFDPLWLHLKEQHKEKYEQMMDFENPYDVLDLYINIPVATFMKPEGIALAIGNDLEKCDYLLSKDERETLLWLMKHFNFDETFDLVNAEVARKEFGVTVEKLPQGDFFLTVDERVPYSLTCGLYYMWMMVDDESLTEYGVVGEKATELLCKFVSEVS